MGCGGSIGADGSSARVQDDQLAAGAAKPEVKIVVQDTDEDLADHQDGAPGHLARPFRKDYATMSIPLGVDEVGAMKLKMRAKLNKARVSLGEVGHGEQAHEEAAPTKKVLMVIDVQDGYDSGFLASLAPDVPGGLAYIQAKHDVVVTQELESRGIVKEYAPGEKRINYDKVWNRGIPAEFMQVVVERVIKEVNSGVYDLVVFTHDFLEGDDFGVFAVDKTPWDNPKKEVTLVKYKEYLTLATDGPGADVHGKIREAFPGLTCYHDRRTVEQIGGAQVMFLRKQVDNAFDESTETSSRTNNEVWLDDIDVDDLGRPKKDAVTLYQKLEDIGFGPHEAHLTFCGVVTNRCVASSLICAVHKGYQATVLKEGSRAFSQAEHDKGLKLIEEKSAGHATLID